MAMFENIPVHPAVDKYYDADELLKLADLQLAAECYDDALFILARLPTHPKAMWLHAMILMDESVSLEETPEESRLKSAEAFLLRLVEREEHNPTIHNELAHLYRKLGHRLCSYGHELKAALLENRGTEVLPAIEKKIAQLSHQEMQDTKGARLIGHCYKESGNHRMAAHFLCLAAECGVHGIAQFEAAEMLSAVGNHSSALTYYHRAELLGCPTLLNRT